MVISELLTSLAPQRRRLRVTFFWACMRSFIVALILISLSGIAMAQFPAHCPEHHYTILGISITGNRTGDAQTIISQSGLYKGEQLTLPSDVVRTSVQQLWNSGIFSKVDVVIDKQVVQSDSSTGLFISIHVAELPHLNKYRIEGNKEIKTTDLDKALSLREGDYLRPWELDAGKTRAQALYEKDGYHFATITFVQVPSYDSASSKYDSSRVDLTVSINEGKEMIVRHIDFEGNDRVSGGRRSAGQWMIPSKKYGGISFPVEIFDEQKYEDDKKKLSTFITRKVIATPKF